jgi:DnaJ-domain-containing protein 1
LDGFIDRLAELLRSLFSEDRGARQGRSPADGRARQGDPDLQDAWQELDEFMKTGSNDRARARGSDRAGSGRASPPPRQPPDESLRQDYANLEVPFGADIETVRRSYKTLMMKYHPDKHAGDPQKQRIALEITKKVNESFERIRALQEKGR